VQTREIFKGQTSRLRAALDWAARHYRNGRPDLAIEELRRFQASDPDNLAVAEQIARLHLDMGAPEAATRGYLTAQAAQKDPASAINNLGVLMYNYGEFERAAALFERAASLNMSAPKVICNWALALVRLGNTKKARTLYSGVLAACPGQVHAHYLLGVELERTGASPEVRALMAGDKIIITPCAQIMAADEETAAYPSRVVSIDIPVMRIAAPQSDRRRVFVPALTDIFIGRPAEAAFFGMITKVRGRADSPEPVLIVDYHDQIKIQRRRFQRMRTGLVISAAWQSRDGLKFGDCDRVIEIDLSAGGVRFSTTTHVDRSMTFQVALIIEGKRMTVDAKALRIRRERDGRRDVRVKFTSLDGKGQEWLNGQLLLLKTLRESR
jgi:hypothetical protein